MMQDDDADELLFTLTEAEWDAFVKRDPPAPNAKLRALLARTPIWDRS